MENQALLHSIFDNRELVNLYGGKLKLLDLFDKTSLSDDKWILGRSDWKFTFDFSLFSLPHIAFCDNVTVSFDGTEYLCSPVIFAKILFLELSKPTSNPGTHHVRFNLLLKLFAFLQKTGKNKIEKVDMQDLFSFLMSVDVYMNRVENRVSVLSYSNCIAHFQIDKIVSTLRKLKCNDLLVPIPRKLRRKALNDACKATADMTAKDYQKGGSFNFLTLDVGRHYIDYCADIFEDNYAHCVALNKTIARAEKFLSAEISKSSLKLVMTEIKRILTGVDIVASPKKDTKGFVNYRTRRARWQNDVIEIFSDEYKRALEAIILLKTDSLSELTNRLGLIDRYDSYEFSRSMIFARIFPDDLPKSRADICEEFLASCEKKIFTIEKFDRICDELLADKLPSSFLPKDAWIRMKQQHSDQEITIQNFIVNTEAAGIVLFVAQTGWRSSEYGFPLESINITMNEDILDGLYIPYRFEVNWSVPKTSGATKLDREVTLSSFLLAWQLNNFNQNASENPCLYSPSGHSKSIYKSESFISTRLFKNWESFVTYYTPFIELDTLDELASQPVLQAKDRETYVRLKEKYASNYKVVSLRGVKNRVRSQLVRLKALNVGNIDGYKNSGEIIAEYARGEISAEYKAVFDEYLSDETKEAIKNKQITVAKDVSKDLNMLVFREMTHDVCYPTAHSFRHIWAEAVLKRYRGDVGKFIRANFKHIDESFFMRYLRNKNVRDIHEMAKRTVINDLVKTHLLQVKDKYKDVAGRVHVFIRRLIKVTEVSSIEQISTKAESFSEHNIIDIKVNSWVTCILKKSSTKRAKCAEDGVPQRQNASPSLCLGCINGDITSGNFIGIMMAIKSSIKVCNNPRLPYRFKMSSIHEVSLAKGRIEELKRNSGKRLYDKAIAILSAALKAAQANK